MKRVTRVTSYIQDFDFRLPVGGVCDEYADNYIPVDQMTVEQLQETAKFYKVHPSLLNEIKDNFDSFKSSVHEDLAELFKQYEAK